MTQIAVPDIGDFRDVAVIEVLIGVGEAVARDQTLVVLESDKATVDVPSTGAGIVSALSVKVGDRVSAGTPLLTLREAGAPTPGASSPAAEPLPVRAAATTTTRIYAGPSVRKAARELGVDLRQVSGSGPRGRIVAQDVRAHGQARPAVSSPAHEPDPVPAPRRDADRYGRTERRPLSRIQRLSGAALHRNWQAIPHVTNHSHADVTDLEAFRASLNAEGAGSGVKVSPLAILLKACVASLRAYPQFNASLDGDALILKHYFHVGFAADTPDGLVVPVIRDVDTKGLLDLAREMAALSAKARAGKLAPADMQGGCFSISSLGGIGGGHFTPIINAPEVAILGAGRTETRVIWADGGPQPRLFLPLSLSWDHRAVDGAAAARFLAHLVESLGDLRRLLR